MTRSNRSLLCANSSGDFNALGMPRRRRKDTLKPGLRYRLFISLYHQNLLNGAIPSLSRKLESQFETTGILLNIAQITPHVILFADRPFLDSLPLITGGSYSKSPGGKSSFLTRTRNDILGAPVLSTIHGLLPLQYVVHRISLACFVLYSYISQILDFECTGGFLMDNVTDS